jgi:hypothetical protein
VDVNLVRINYAGSAMCATPDEVIPAIDRMTVAGKGVYGMKIVGGGDLSADPAKAVRYVLDLKSVHALVMGMMDEKQILANAGLVGDPVPHA